MQNHLILRVPHLVSGKFLFSFLGTLLLFQGSCFRFRKLCFYFGNPVFITRLSLPAPSSNLRDCSVHHWQTKQYILVLRTVLHTIVILTVYCYIYIRMSTMKPKLFWIQIWWYHTFLIKVNFSKLRQPTGQRLSNVRK